MLETLLIILVGGFLVIVAAKAIFVGVLLLLGAYFEIKNGKK